VSTALALALGATGCAKTTDAEVRAAFERAQQGGGSTEAKRPTRERERGRRPRSRLPDDDPWSPVQEKLGEAIAVFAKATDPATFDALAERWCDVRPQPIETEDGYDYVCYPKPPLRVSGRSFTLELSASGVIGLQSDELTGVESRQFADRAREVASRFCATPFAAVRAEDPGPRAQEFSTCPSDGGVTLAVGRFPAAADGDRWRVSLSVLGSS
jgi:hypothetical protein